MTDKNQEFPRCCEQGTREQPVCPECAEINDGYQGCLGIGTKGTPREATAASIEGLTARIAELERERDKLIQAVADHATVRCEYQRVQGVLVGALEAAEQALRYLGGTLHADRCAAALAAVQQPANPEGWRSLAPVLSAAQQTQISAAATDVLAERRRQIEAEGWTPEHDDAHSNGEMAVAAGLYALRCGYPHEREFGVPRYWPWNASWWKPSTTRRNLVKSGALILAEIERIDRAAQQPEWGEA